MKILYFIITPIALCVLQSCDPGYQIFYTVENNTNDSLWAKTPRMNGNDTIKYIPPRQNIEIYTDFGLGRGSNINCCACGLGTQKLVLKDTTRHNTKDIKTEGNWILEHDGKDVVRCRFKVNQSDIH